MERIDKPQAPYRKWLVAVGCFLMIFLGLGFCSSNKSLYLGAITEALDIKRSLFALQDTLRFAVTAVVNMFFGVLVSKLGPKLMTYLGFLGYIAYLWISIFADQLIWFYVAGCLLGFGTAFCSTTMVSHLVGLWFPEKRGTVSGAIMCANGLGGAIAAQIITPLIDGSLFGYRKAYMIALMIAAVAGVLVTIMVTEPKGVKTTVGKKKSKGKQWVGISFREAIRKPYFYVAILCVCLTGMALQGIHGIAATHIKDVGVDSTFKSLVLSTASLVLIGSKFLAGISYDKLGLRKTLLFCEICGVIAFACLAYCANTGVGRVLAMTYGVLSSLALPLETVMVSLIVADLFGEKDFSKLLGLFVGANYAGYAIGGFVYNLVFDLTGSYVSLLLITSGLMVVIAVAFQLIITAANKVHDKVVAKQIAE